MSFQNEEGKYKYSYRDSITSGIIDPHSALTGDDAVDLVTYGKAVLSGMVGTTMIVNSLIFEKETNNSDFNSVTVMAPIYQEQYTLDSFYSFLGNFIGMIIVLPLIFIFSRQVAVMVMEKEVHVV